MSVTNASGMSHVKTYNSIARNSFFRVMIDSFFHALIHMLAKQRIDGKYVILTYQPMREQNACHMTHILVILRCASGVFLPET